jgi:hypothetical protein
LIWSGLEYAPGDPVRVCVRHRDQAVTVTDEGGAVERAGRPAGWRAAAERVADERVVNITRQGVLTLPVVRVGPGEQAIVARVAEASQALYQDLLELAGCGRFTASRSARRGSPSRSPRSHEAVPR